MGSCEAGFDALLQDFVRSGYQPEMGNRLIEIINANSLDLELHDVWVLPGELDRLLELTGNPLADSDIEDEEAPQVTAPPFDLDNPEHRSALAERMNEMYT
jgi:hypothetical protein